MRDERQRRLRLVADSYRLAQRARARAQSRLIAREHACDRLPRLHPIARLRRDHESDAGVHRIVHRRAPAAERDDPAPHRARLDLRDEAPPRRAKELDRLRLREQRGIIHHFRIPALCLDDLLELLGRGAARDRTLQCLARRRAIVDHPAEHHHLRGERVRHLHQIRRPFALQRMDRFLRLQRVAARAPERAIHRRDQRDHRTFVRGAELDHRSRELDAALERLQKRTRPALHVEHQSREPLRELLAHDARRDQRDRFHRRRRITQCVQLPVHRRDLAALAEQHAADA